MHGTFVLCNAKVVEASRWRPGREGCMSVPDLTGDVKRAGRVVVRGRPAGHRASRCGSRPTRSRRAPCSTRSTTAPACCSSTGWPARTRCTSARSICDGRKRVRVAPARRRGPARAAAYGDRIMRLTVGPLPPAVYWRRRAIVLGVAVVLVFLIVQSCSGGEGKSNGGGVPASATQGPDRPTPTVVIKRPQSGAPTSAGPAPAPAPTSAPRRRHATERPPAGERRLHRRRGVGDPGAGRARAPSAARRSSSSSGSRTSPPVRAAATSAPTCRSSTSSRAPKRCWSSDTCGTRQGHRRAAARAQHRARIPGRPGTAATPRGVPTTWPTGPSHRPVTTRSSPGWARRSARRSSSRCT